MRKFALLLVLCLTACQSPKLTTEERQALTFEARAYEIQALFNTYLVLINDYAAQPFCGEGRIIACAERDTVVELNKLAKQSSSIIALSIMEKDIASARAALSLVIESLHKKGVINVTR